MKEYIATCYSHFGSIRYHKLCKNRNWAAKMMPVPRTLSSSCGTCVRYQPAGEDICPAAEVPEEVEQIVEILPDGYRCVYRAANS